MRWCSLLLSLVLIAWPLHAVDLTGIVLDQSGEPTSGATVKVVGVGIDTTTQTGEFRIPIPNTRIGQRVNIQIAKDGWTPASDQPLAFIVPADPVSAENFRPGRFPRRILIVAGRKSDNKKVSFDRAILFELFMIPLQVRGMQETKEFDLDLVNKCSARGISLADR